MPIPLTGPVNFRNATYGIATEFGGAQPDGISEYYLGGATGYVPANAGGSIAASGAQKWSNYRGSHGIVAPVWTPIPDQTVQGGSTLTLDVAPYISDPAATITLDGMPVSGITFSGTTVTVNLENSGQTDLENLVTLRATNSAGSATTTVKVVVTPGPFVPYFTDYPREFIHNPQTPRERSRAGQIDIELGASNSINIYYYDESDPAYDTWNQRSNLIHIHAATDPGPAALTVTPTGSYATSVTPSIRHFPKDATRPERWQVTFSSRVSGYVGGMEFVVTTPEGSAMLYVGWETTPRGSGTASSGTTTTLQPSNGTHNVSGNLRWSATSNNVDFVWGAPSSDGNATPSGSATDNTGWGIKSIGGIQNIGTGAVFFVVNLVNDLDGQKNFTLTLRFGSNTVTLRSSSGSSVITGSPPYRQVQIKITTPLPDLRTFDGQIIPFTAVMT